MTILKQKEVVLLRDEQNIGHIWAGAMLDADQLWTDLGNCLGTLAILASSPCDISLDLLDLATWTWFKDPSFSMWASWLVYEDLVMYMELSNTRMCLRVLWWCLRSKASSARRAWLGWECSWGGICGVGSEGTCVLQARHGFSCWDLCTACCPVSTGAFKIFADVRIEDIWKNLVDLCIRDCIQSCSSFIASQQGMTIECPSCLSWLRHMKASHIVTNTANTVIKFVWIA